MLYFSAAPGRKNLKKILQRSFFAAQADPLYALVSQCEGQCSEPESMDVAGPPAQAGGAYPLSRKLRALSGILFLDAVMAYSSDGMRELADFAETIAAAQEGFLIFDQSNRIILCNKAFAGIFNLSGSPLGLTFDAVFRRDSVLPGSIHSEQFYHAAGKRDCPPYADLLLNAWVGADEAGKTDCLAQILPYRLDGNPAVLCRLRSLAGLIPPADIPRPSEHERSLYEQNQELLRLNAQLRIENAERSAVAQALRRAESRYRDIFDNATEGIFQWTPDRRLISANMSFAGMMGFPTVNALFFSVAERDFQFCYSSQAERELLAALERKGAVSNFEFQVVRNDGTHLWASMNARRVPGSGGYTNYYEAFIENISGRKLAEEKLVHQAFHDSLTGLANRALFHDRLRMALKRAARQQNYSFAVLYLDLDRFKIVNDSFGHNIGDNVLRHAAVEILTCVREVDTVARLGGDEFAVLIEGMERGSYAVQVAKRIHAALSQPFGPKGREISIGASIGIVLKGEGYDLPEDILRDADTAMYKAKADQGTYYKIFSHKMREETLKTISLEKDLRQGIKDGEFFVVYQPVISMHTGKPHGFEALLRWNRAGRIVGPASFIPMAEETGLIKSLGLYVIEEVCRQVMEWKKVYSHSFITHLNVSGRQLSFPSFPREVQDILDRTGVDPSWLLFEITESILLDSDGGCIQGIHHLRDLGIAFCLDDFGTGFSPLSYLRQLPLSCIKVDRSFVSDLETDAHSLAIVRHLLSLGKDLGLSVIVEGIERQSQAERLMSVGCALMQGYHFHQPLDADKAAALLDWSDRL